MGHLLDDHSHDRTADHRHGVNEETGHGHGHGSWWDRLAHGLSEVVGGHSHDTADQIDEALEADRAGRRALLISLVGLGVTAVLQAVVVVLSGSVALLGDTLHNVADALTALPLLIAFTLARRLPTKRYTYGYGRAEDIAGLFVIAIWRSPPASPPTKRSPGSCTHSPSRSCGRWPARASSVSSVTKSSPATAFGSDADRLGSTRRRRVARAHRRLHQPRRHPWRRRSRHRLAMGRSRRGPGHHGRDSGRAAISRPSSRRTSHGCRRPPDRRPGGRRHRDR